MSQDIDQIKIEEYFYKFIKDENEILSDLSREEVEIIWEKIKQLKDRIDIIIDI